MKMLIDGEIETIYAVNISPYDFRVFVSEADKIWDFEGEERFSIVHSVFLDLDLQKKYYDYAMKRFEE